MGKVPGVGSWGAVAGVIAWFGLGGCRAIVLLESVQGRVGQISADQREQLRQAQAQRQRQRVFGL